jgi:hypothetical protein
MLSDATRERMKRIEEMITWVMDTFKVPRSEAWQFVQTNGVYKIAERAERMDERARKNALAELHAKAADVATLKAQLDVDK